MQVQSKLIKTICEMETVIKVVKLSRVVKLTSATKE